MKCPHCGGGIVLEFPKQNKLRGLKMDMVIMDESKDIPDKKIPDVQFILFWAQYPNKKAKPLALRAWKKIKPDQNLFDTIMAALEAHKKTPQWVKNDGEFIPHPSTWLNQRRWEDELKTSKVGSTKYQDV